MIRSSKEGHASDTHRVTSMLMKPDYNIMARQLTKARWFYESISR